MLYKLYTETYFPVVARLRPRSRSRRRSTLHSVARTAARRGGLGNSERVCLGRVSVSSRERKHVISYTRRHIFRWSLVCGRGRGHVHDGGVHYTQSRAPLRGEVDSEILNEFIISYEDGEGPHCLTLGKYGQGPLSEGERWVLIESVGED